MVVCVIRGCKSRGYEGGRTYFCVPSEKTDARQRKAWRRVLKSQGVSEKALKSGRVCDLHFAEGCPSGFPNDEDYVPRDVHQLKFEMKQAGVSQSWTLHAKSWCGDVMETMYLLQRGGILCDTSLRTSDGMFHAAHSLVLAASSPCLANILQDVKQQSTPSVLAVEYSSDAILQVLSFVYTGKLRAENRTIMTEISKIAKEFQIGSLTNWCQVQVEQDSSESQVDISLVKEDTVQEGEIGRWVAGGDGSVVSCGPAMIDTELEKCSMGIKEEETDSYDEYADEVINSTKDGSAVSTAQAHPPLSVEDANSQGHNNSESWNDSTVSLKTCQICGLRFLRLGNHMKTHKGEVQRTNEISECEEMAPETGVNNEMDAVNTSKEEQRKFPCEICDKYLSSKQGLDIHLRTHTGEKPFRCGVCDQPFAQIANLRKHERRVHHLERPSIEIVSMNTATEKKQQFPCETCGKILSSKQGLEVHLRTHTGEKPFSCDICDQQFAQMPNLRKHKRRVHSQERPHQCPKCEKCFKTTDAAKVHLLALHPTAPMVYVCRFCGKTMNREESLRLHEQRHTTPPGKHKCDICDKVFNYSMSLKSHMSRHLGQLPGQVCDICGGVFQNIHKHRATHDENREKKYQCSYCPKKFALKGNMIMHERSHSGERPFQCRYCSKSFHTSRNRKRHELTHTGERAFSCEVCGKSFAQADRLKSHKQIHSDLRRYKCDVCGKDFKQREVLNTHLRNVHADMYEPRAAGIALAPRETGL